MNCSSTKMTFSPFYALNFSFISEKNFTCLVSAVPIILADTRYCRLSHNRYRLRIIMPLYRYSSNTHTHTHAYAYINRHNTYLVHTHTHAYINRHNTYLVHTHIHGISCETSILES